jgi:hypothetical protein
LSISHAFGTGIPSLLLLMHLGGVIDRPKSTEVRTPFLTAVPMISISLVPSIGVTVIPFIIGSPTEKFIGICNN